MASVGFALIASKLSISVGFIGGPMFSITPGIAGALGAVVDQLFLMPNLFPQKDNEGPRLDDLRLAGTKEGSPHNLVYGKTRVPCQLAWQSDLQEIKDTSSGSGKGGSGGEFITYKYRADACWNICRNRTQRLVKLIADGKTIWDAEPDFDIDGSTLIEADTEDYSFGGPTVERLILRTTSVGPDLTKLKSGNLAVVEGFTGPAAANNSENSSNGESWLVVSSKRDPLTGETEAKMWDPLGALVATNFVVKAAGDPVSLFSELPTHKASMIQSVTFYDGSQTSPDPIIEAIEGSGEVPASIERTRITLGQLLLTDFGNRLPNLEAVVEESVTPKVAKFIKDICLRSGLSEAQVDVTDIDSFNYLIDGYHVRGPQKVKTVLQPVMLMHDIMVRDVSGVMTFFHRTNAPTLAVPTADLGAHQPGSNEIVRPFRVVDEPEIEKPRFVEVSFKNLYQDYATGVVRAINPNAPSHHVETITLEIAMTPETAFALAQKLLWLMWVSREACTGHLPPTYLDLEEGTILQFTDVMGDDWNILTERIERGENGLVQWEGKTEDQEVLIQEGLSDQTEELALEGGGTQDGPHALPSPLEEHYLSIPPLANSHVGHPGVYLAALNEDRNLPYRGGQVYKSTDEGVTWQKMQEAPIIDHEAFVGRVVSFTNTSVDPAFIDYVNEIEVDMLFGTLFSVTEEQMLHGLNRLYIGGEIIGFTTATPDASVADRWKLTGLLRGLRNTEDEIAGHSVGEFVVDLTGPGIFWIPLGAARVGKDTRLKVVPNGGEIERYPPSEITSFNGGTARPLAPFAFDHYWTNTTLDVWFDWRTPAITDEILQERTPLGTDRPVFECDLYKNSISEANFLRTVVIEALFQKPNGDYVWSGFRYLQATWTADGFTKGTDDLLVVAYQVSPLVGRGKASNTYTIDDG